jgi:hypothetical protein
MSAPRAPGPLGDSGASRAGAPSPKSPPVVSVSSSELGASRAGDALVVALSSAALWRIPTSTHPCRPCSRPHSGLLRYSPRWATSCRCLFRLAATPRLLAVAAEPFLGGPVLLPLPSVLLIPWGVGLPLRGLLAAPLPPGVSFSSFTLCCFYALRVPGRVADDAPLRLCFWIHSASGPRSLRVCEVGNALNFVFSSPLDRFRVRQLLPGVFKSATSSENLARFLVTRGGALWGRSTSCSSPLSPPCWLPGVMRLTAVMSQELPE